VAISPDPRPRGAGALAHASWPGGTAERLDDPVAPGKAGRRHPICDTEAAVRADVHPDEQGHPGRCDARTTHLLRLLLVTGNCLAPRVPGLTCRFIRDQRWPLTRGCNRRVIGSSPIGGAPPQISGSAASGATTTGRPTNPGTDDSSSARVRVVREGQRRRCSAEAASGLITPRPRWTSRVRLGRSCPRWSAIWRAESPASSRSQPPAILQQVDDEGRQSDGAPAAVVFGNSWIASPSPGTRARGSPRSRASRPRGPRQTSAARTPRRSARRHPARRRRGPAGRAGWHRDRRPAARTAVEPRRRSAPGAPGWDAGVLAGL